ncbi:phospholipid-translocating ATPase, partial [Clavulina sp. PMI_390]
MAPKKGRTTKGKPTSGFAAAYARWADWEITSLFHRTPPPRTPRTIYVNEPLPETAYDIKKNGKKTLKKENVYATNQVVTSKYTIFTFLPRNLLEQFRRVANIFFLAIDILQFFPKFSTISPGLVILPLLAILLLTAAKDGYEDVKRHDSDRSINHSEVDVLEGGGYENPNTMGPKSKTFSPGNPFKGKKKRGAEDDTSSSGSDEQDPATIADEEKDAAAEGRVDAQRTMRVQLPPPDDNSPLVSGDSGRHPGSPTFTPGPLARQPTARIPRSENPFETLASDNDPHWAITIWEDLKVGDFVRLRNNQSIPADIVLCATSEPENVAYVETKNLDGETNLKSRNAVPELTHLRSAHAIVDGDAKFRIDAEAPDVNMYKFNAAVILPPAEGESEDRQHPIDIQTTLLRGTVLRNTDWVIGIVVYTGADSKIVLNSGNTPSKRSRVERQMNPMVLINLVLLALMAVVCGIVDAHLEQHYYPKGALWLYNDNGKDDNPHINGLITFLNAFITFQNVIPISLYVSIEFVRTAQAAFIYFDMDMVYRRPNKRKRAMTASAKAKKAKKAMKAKKSKKGKVDEKDQAEPEFEVDDMDETPTLARSWNLADDLGQIEYIFSDKTGTLTQNSMEFRQCSIGGVTYEGQAAQPTSVATENDISSDNTVTAPTSTRPIDTFVPPVANPDVHPPKVKLSEGVLAHFIDPQLAADIRNANGSSEGRHHAQVLNDFFTCLGLCHSVLASIEPLDDDEPKEGEIDVADGAVSYKAQSPDEAALVQAAADVGYIFLGRESATQIVRLQTPHIVEPRRYELLNLLDFTSARKRMSVILRELDTPERRIILLCKGADNVIFERLERGRGEQFKEKTGQDLDRFANEGLRTLCLAHRYLTEEEYDSWNAAYRNAQVQLVDRDEHIESVSSEIEQNLFLLGATAIEDKLQDGVPETIADLKRAGIKIWVATGDKLETAIAIGQSTNLISRESNLVIVRGSSELSAYDQLLRAAERYFPDSEVVADDTVRPVESRQNDRLRRVDTGLQSIVGADNGQRAGGFVLVIDGAALGQALEEEHSKELLLEVSTQCEAVVCCRVSPLQKALIVKLVKDGLGVMTLAIGDGANDVSMIQAADVGVGISGEEGLQAVNSSDYAIAQFRFLKRLLLVHGQWTYARNGNMILNFFYKNIVGVAVLWWFQIYCGWSTTYVFEYTYLLFWNVFWSLAPVIAIGIFDRNIDSEALMAIPELYRFGRERLWFGSVQFVIYMLDGLYQSAVVFFVLLYSYITTTTRKDGYDVFMFEFSTTMVISAVMVVNAFHGISTSAWTGWIWFAVSIGVILIWAYTAVYSAIPPSAFAVPVYGIDHYMFRSAYYWFGLILTFFIAMLPRYLTKASRVLYTPNDIDILRIVHKLHPDIDIARHPLLGGQEDLYPLEPRSPIPRPLPPTAGSRTDMSTGLPMTDRGFGFSTEEGGVAIRRIQTNLSE